MNDVKRSLPLGERNGRPDDLDGLLRRFFRSEMPDPWPAPPIVSEPPRQDPAQPRGFWFRHSSRLALAAAVSFFLVGYLTLSALFPASSTEAGGQAAPPVIGNLPRVQPIRPEIVPLRNGKAEISGHQTQGPSRRIFLHVKEIR
jgi:hypothetical protein